MGSGNCSGCKCKKEPDENEILFTEKNQQIDTSLDAMNHEVKEGNERNKINNMIKGNIPSDLFKEDIINLNYGSTSKRENLSMTPRGRQVLNGISGQNEDGSQFINESNSNANDNNANAKDKSSNIKGSNNSNEPDPTNTKLKDPSSSEVNLNKDDINGNEQKSNSNHEQGELKNYLKSIRPSQSLNQKYFSSNKHHQEYQEEKCENINFGMSNPSELTFEQQKLLFDTQKNLNQFYPPQATELKTLNSKLKKIPLTSIVPEYKLLNTIANDELIFNGDLKKLINYEISAHKPQLYSSRFCTLTKSAFRYYKSKEQYLTMNKPTCTVPLNQITKLSFIKTKKTSKKIDHILICNKLGIIKEKKEIANSKQFELYEQHAYENNESLLIFTSEIEEFLFKWYLLLDFFLSERK